MRGPGVIVRGMTERAGDRATALSQRVLRAQARLEELMQVLAGSMARLQATRQEIQAGRSQRAQPADQIRAGSSGRFPSMIAGMIDSASTCHASRSLARLVTLIRIVLNNSPDSPGLASSTSV